MKITINHQSPAPEFLTKSTGNRPGVYIDKDATIWLVNDEGKLFAVLDVDGYIGGVVDDYCPDKIARYQIRRLPNESSITLANNDRD